MTISIPQIDNSWTLFLDRDGVINKKLEGDYVKTIDEFEFLPLAVEAIKLFSSRFHKIVIVTNQQGIGKKLMTKHDLKKVHQHLIHEVQKHGGQIDAVYFAPELAEENSILRKPNIGMALMAQQEFPSIDFNKSIMVGDSNSDMEFAQNANMFGVFIGQSEKCYAVDSLMQLSQLI